MSAEGVQKECRRSAEAVCTPEHGRHLAVRLAPKKLDAFPTGLEGKLRYCEMRRVSRGPLSGRGTTWRKSIRSSRAVNSGFSVVKAMKRVLNVV